MDDNNQNSPPIKDDSLESIETVSQASADIAEQPVGNSYNPPKPDEKPQMISLKRSFYQRLQAFVGRINIYLLLFLLLLLLTGIAAFASYQASKNAAQPSITNQTLSTADLSSLINNETQVGDATQVLTVASNSIFNGQVLIRDNLDVAGTIHVGGSLNLPGITVSGVSTFEDLQVGNNLTVTGNTFVQGVLTAQGGLVVSGGATFSGAISAPSFAIDQLILSQNLQLNRHIEAGGSTPGAYAGTGVGGGGTVSVNGSDTAGTVTINFGAGPVAGILANVTFVNGFNQTPHVVITPVGSNCAALNYYVNRTTAGFSVATTNAGTANTSCSFDYVAID